MLLKYKKISMKNNSKGDINMTMTEHEKLLAGHEYDYRDPEIQAIMGNCRRLLQIVNQATNLDKRQAAIQAMLNQVGKNFTLNGQVNILYGKHLSVGDDVFINGNCNFQDSNLITIGNRVLVGPDSKFYCGNHSLDATKRFGIRPNGEKYLISYTKPITIGDDVWIGGNVTIVGGVKIGSNVIIGAGAVVTKDIPDNSVVGGVPARLIKKLPEIQGREEI